MLRFHLLLLAWLLVGFTTPAMAGGEHQRRMATELLVLAGDIGKLQQSGLSDLHKDGLIARIGGGLASLEILARLADQERGLALRDYKKELNGLRQAWGTKDILSFKTILADLIKQHLFQATGILPLSNDPAGQKRAKALHEELCAACHDEPDLEVSRPAFNLFEQARSLPLKEFAARMVIGVRGDRVTGIDNPLGDAELSALIYYYQASKP